MAKAVATNKNAARPNIDANVGYNEANKLNYIINEALMAVNTCMPCRIEAVNDSDVFGTYDVLPLINIKLVDGTPMTQPVIRDVPYSHEIGGNAGIIINPVVGDTVLVVFSQRDISTLQKEWEQTTPQSNRKFSLADAIIVKQLSNTAPSIYIKVTNVGIEIVSPNLPVAVNAQNVNITATQNVNISATNTATITASTANIDATEVNLGANPVGGVVIADEPITISLDGAPPVPAVISGGSLTVKASL